MTRARVSLPERLDEADLGHLVDTLRRSFRLDGLTQDAGGLVLNVHDEVPAAKLELILNRLVRARRYASSDVLFARDVSPPEGCDPQAALEERGDVQKLAPGLFAFRGEFLTVRNALDVKVREIASRQGATELSYPSLWPAGVLQSIDYFHDFPQLPLLACGVEPDYEARDVFASRFRKTSAPAPIACTAENGLAPATAVLAPTVCDCCYWLLRGRRDVTDQTLTVIGQVFRNESSAEGRLDRLTSFTMREIVVIGSPAYVLAQRDALVEEMKDLVTALDLACTIKAADDPFFCNDAVKKSILQSVHRLKYEAEMPLYSGRRMAVASINLHNDFFSRNYDYKNSDSSLHSACVGFGYERLTYALFCRHGQDLKHWPKSVMTYLNLIQS